MSRFRFSENARWYTLGLGLTGALVLLAILQFHSNRQLRDVLQKQMCSTLQGSLMNVRFGLEQEFSPICNTLRSPVQKDNLEAYPREFARWRNTAVHPALVADLYVTQHVRPSESGLFRLQPDGSKFEAVDWPANLIPLRGKLDQMSAADSLLPSWLIEENVPALVHSLRDSENPRTLSFVIVQLNLKELAHHILPELAQRYLGSNGHLDYQIALISRNADRSLVYSSDAGFGAADDRTSDAQLNVFGHRWQATAVHSLGYFHLQRVRVEDRVIYETNVRHPNLGNTNLGQTGIGQTKVGLVNRSQTLSLRLDHLPP